MYIIALISHCHTLNTILWTLVIECIYHRGLKQIQLNNQKTGLALIVCDDKSVPEENDGDAQHLKNECSKACERLVAIV